MKRTQSQSTALVEERASPTREEGARSILDFRDERERRCFIIPDFYDTTFKNEEWAIKYELSNPEHYTGVYKPSGVVQINYDGVPEHALIGDLLRKACEQNKINYVEVMANDEDRGIQRVKMLREAGSTLIAIANRLEAQQ